MRQSARFREGNRMTIQARRPSSRLLLILALATALLAGIVAVQWAMRQTSIVHSVVRSSESHYVASVPGGGVGGDGGGGH